MMDKAQKEDYVRKTNCLLSLLKLQL